MSTRIHFEMKGLDITAQAFITNSGLVTNLDIFYHGLDEVDYPTGEDLEEIEDTASELLQEEFHTAECNF